MRLFLPPKWVWGMGGVLVVGGLITAGVYMWNTWERFSSAPAESLSVSQVTEAPSEVKEMSYELVEGWNFISFPFKPTSVTSAAELMADVTRHGGYVTMVSRWDRDHWQEYVQRGTNSFGHDFKLNATEGYFIRNEKQTTWKVSGVVAKDLVPKEVPLHTGWNTVGFVQYSTAQAMLNYLSRDGIERGHEMDRWVSGNWDVFVKRWYSETNIQEYGNNFRVEPGRGYMIRMVKEAVIPTGL